MADEPADVAIDQIEQAELPSTVYRTARRLLDRAARQGGQLRITEEEMIAICSDAKAKAAEATVRSHLVQLQSAGIVRYSRRGMVSIFFEAWAGAQLTLAEDDEKVIVERSNRALSDHFEAAENAEVIAQRSERALSDHFGDDEDTKSDRSAIKSRAERSNRALSDHFDADSLTRAPARALGGGGLSDHPTSRKSRKKPPTTNHQPSFADEHQQLAFSLLVDWEVGVDREVAEILARSLPPLDIYRVVDDWLPDRRAGRVRPPSLCHRLERTKPSNAPYITLSPDFLSSEVYHRHRLPDDLVRDPRQARRSEYNNFDF